MCTRLLQKPYLFSLCRRNGMFTNGNRAISDLPSDPKEQKEKLLKMIQEDLPKPYDGPERDFVNFPRKKRAIYPDKLRLGFLPEEWFQFFYKKTGVTGPYVFGTGLITYLLSKELFVIEDEFSTGVAIFLMVYIAIKKFGPGIRSYGEKLQDDEDKMLEGRRAQSIEAHEKMIEGEKKAQWNAAVSETLLQAKRENVLIQLETEYRRRLMNVYKEVKKRLDYHLEMDNTRRKLEQKHMVDWIVDNVMKSITPQQEKEALQKCILDLKALSVKI